jgi:deoxyribodipyrimidine photolyase-related protein
MIRRLNLVLGDQQDHGSSILRDFQPEHDRLWMAEVHGENTHVPHHKHQIVLFLASMRHFAAHQEAAGRPVLYTELSPNPAQDRGRGLGDVLEADLRLHQPREVRVVLPGDKRVLAQLQEVCARSGTPLTVLDDDHFFSTPEQFRQHSKGRKTLRLEYFYRELRRRHNVLMTDGQPIGGQWNFDAENRESFGPAGPPEIPPVQRFAPDEIVSQVSDLVEQRYPHHPGQTKNFALPVTRDQALVLLDEFIALRLPRFGEFQDAMWQGEFFLYHSRLSTSMNIKLLSSREVCDAAVAAYHRGQAPLSAVEGFVRQIIGWREYIRGVYWTAEPGYAEQNFLGHKQPLPGFFWSGKTEMKCLSDTLEGVHRNAYSHHIQRLMITGLFCLLYGVDPAQYNDWHLATHGDAIDWVSTPNVIGMSQFADGGLLASKPYCASGNYINKMSNYCKSCVYNPKLATGPKACPFTTLYWNFLDRHQDRLRNNPRLSLQLQNVIRKTASERQEIAQAATALRENLA